MLEKLLSELEYPLMRLDVYLSEPSTITPSLEAILAQILECMLDVLALYAKYFEDKLSGLRRLLPRRAGERQLLWSAPYGRS